VRLLSNRAYRYAEKKAEEAIHSPPSFVTFAVGKEASAIAMPVKRLPELRVGFSIL
jgi:hypothetical protein